MRTDNAVGVWPDDALKNFIFYIFSMYEFSHSLGQSLPTHSAQMPTFDRGRDAHYCAPPAQIRTGPIRAYGSHLGCMTALRDILVTCRMRSNACDTVTRL